MAATVPILPTVLIPSTVLPQRDPAPFMLLSGHYHMGMNDDAPRIHLGGLLRAPGDISASGEVLEQEGAQAPSVVAVFDETVDLTMRLGVDTRHAITTLDIGGRR